MRTKLFKADCSTPKSLSFSLIIGDFYDCNYSPNTIQSAINRISKISQTETLQSRPKQSTTERSPLVLTYHPHMHRIKRIFHRNFKKILQHEKSDTKHIFTSPPLLAYKRDTNLKKLLVRRSLNPKPNGTHPCGHSLCRTCEHTNPSDALSGPKSTFHIQHHFTCSSVCVIYSTACTKCSITYIGETCRQLSTRFGEHLLAHLSVLFTPLLVPNAPFYILVKLAVSSIPDLENT